MNEVSFVVIMPLVPVLQVLAEGYLNVQLPILSEININSDFLSGVFLVDYLDILSLPYYIVTVYFILRTYLRYPFIRLTGYSHSGLPPLLIALLLTAGLPIVYFFVGVVASNILLIFFAIVYLIVGVVGMIV